MSAVFRLGDLFGAADEQAQPASTFFEWIQDLLRLPSREQSSAEQFASWLPYSAYIGSEQIFVNRDGLGFMLEITPQSGADERMVEVLVSLYSSCPAGTGIQFNLFASPHIRGPLLNYANLRVEDADQVDKAQHWGRSARNDNLFRLLARSRVEHLLSAAHRSMTSGFHYSIRDFRLMMSVTVPGDGGDLRRREEFIALREAMVTTLKAASLSSRCLRCLGPDQLGRVVCQPPPHQPVQHSDASLRRRARDSRPGGRLRHHPGRLPAGLAPLQGGQPGRDGVPLLLDQEFSGTLSALADGLADWRPDAAGTAVQRPVHADDGDSDPRHQRHETDRDGQSHSRPAERGIQDGPRHARRRQEAHGLEDHRRFR